jgi:formate-dependent nitrite reductase membrane component NrfD
MAATEMVGDSFRLGYRFQRHWDNSMAAAFFCAEVGAGLFLVALLAGSPGAMTAGLLLATIGKSAFHLWHMGVPAKSWRAILRPDRSWVSRGLIALVVLAVAGGLHILFKATIGTTGLDAFLRFLAAIAGLVVMSYQGFAMAQSSAFGLWNTAIMPLASLLYGLTAGVMILLALASRGATTNLGAAGVDLVTLALVLLAADALMLGLLLYAAFHGSPGARLSAELLARTRFAAWFHGLVVIAGIALPIALLLSGGNTAARVTAAIAMLIGFLAFRVLVFKAAVYEPVMPFRIP